MRRLQNKRRYRRREADSANAILDRLSSPSAHPSRKRIEELVELLRETEQREGELSEHLYSHMRKRPRSGDMQHFDELQAVETSRAQKAYTAVIGRVNRILSRYRAIPVLLPAVFWVDDHTGLRFDWQPERDGKWRKWEIEAVQLILGLIEKRELHRLHKCRNCSKWFYAVTDHQLHCSDTCRKQFASRDPKFKERRRRYMASRRREEKESEKRWLAAMKLQRDRRTK